MGTSPRWRALSARPLLLLSAAISGGAVLIVALALLRGPAEVRGEAPAVTPTATGTAAALTQRRDGPFPLPARESGSQPVSPRRPSDRPLPTSTPRPGELATRLAMPTPTPWPTPEPIPTRWAQPPGATWTTYTDPVYRFSFDYPANWERQGTKVWNWTPSLQVKRSGTPPEELAVEITVLPELGPTHGYTSLDDWLARRQLFHPDTQYRDLHETRVDGRRALRWEAHGGLVPEGAIVVAVAEGDRIYLLVAYPAHTIHRDVFERLLASFRLPP